MARMRTVLAVVCAMCAMALMASSAAAESPQTLMFHKINNYRRAHGVAAVRLSRSLRHSARRYAHKLMREGYFGHARRIEASHKYRTLGEILEIQRGLKPHVEWAFKAWIHSGEHRSIILGREFTYAGAGRAKGWFHGHRDTIWVMHFGHP